MKKTRTSAAAAALIAVAGLSYIGLSGATASSTAKAPAEVVLPVTVDDFRLSDQTLHSHELRQLGDASAIVLITQANNCPVSRNTSAAVKALQDEYSAKGVEIFMLNSTPTDTREAIVAEATDTICPS
jgi:ABC-type sugar transport system substrate-binding protein